ncbi:MAG: hypothetical protein KC613_24800, partial [Myxococcales bacterium]|nr:hypothetical protein [Myxococcales bacterium]
VTPAARRALRFWAVAGTAYGGLLAAAVAVFVPWKTPWINALLVAYGALWPVAGHGLWRTRRWGWRLGVGAAFLGLLAMVLVFAGLLGSWSYLHGIYGDFGHGASIGALLFASVALQVLGLVPALALRALLRADVREAMGAGKGWLRAVLGVGLIPLVALAYGHWLGRLPTIEPLSEAQRTLAVRYLRAALERTDRPALDALKGVPTGPGPLFATVWHDGNLVARGQGRAEDLAQALEQAAHELTQHPRLQARAEGRGRIKVDRTLGVGAVARASAPVVALSVNPGLDGLRRVAGEQRSTLLADDLVRMQRFGAAPLVPGIRELRFGLDGQWALARLGLPEGRLERVRSEGFVEFQGQALPVVRGNTPPDGTGPPTWEAAAVAGGHFILRQIMKDGRFHYQYFPLADRHPDPRRSQYSPPRPPGTVYPLAPPPGPPRAPPP